MDGNLDGSTAGGTGGEGISGTGGIGGTGRTGSGGESGMGGGGTAGGAIPDGGASDRTCQQAPYRFVPRAPIVFLLVDRSGSMFTCRTAGGALDPTGRQCANHADTAWYPLRDGVLDVVQKLETDVRFGFSAFTGETSDSVCPVLRTTPPMLNNYAAVAGEYNGLLPLLKGQSPTRKALDLVGNLLTTNNDSAEKFILLVTDGTADYCVDGNALCPPDSVVGGLQTLRTAGIKTLILSLASPISTVSDAVLQAFANAGAGQPVLPPLAPGLDLGSYSQQCGGVTGWRADLAAAGKPFALGATIGSYSTTGGTAAVYQPAPTNQMAPMNQLATALSGMKGCIFDLSDSGGNPLRVDLTQLDKAHVLIVGTEIPLSDSSGWHMNTATQLELTGSACATWRTPSSTTIDFQFPCDIVMP